MDKYAIRIFKTEYCFEHYSDSIYRHAEKDVCKDDIQIEKTANTKDYLIELWYDLLKEYEGWTYCIKNVVDDEIITGGVFDPSDIEYIEEYFENKPTCKDSTFKVCPECGKVLGFNSYFGGYVCDNCKWEDVS